jgi:prepilin-type processing-associated H-X9-DG protein
MGSASAWPAPAATSFADFSNPSRSITVVESGNTGIHWLEPRDFELDRLRSTVYAPSWAYSSRRSYSGQAISSGHPGGANVLFGDGSLEFLSTETAPELLKEMLVIGKRQIPLGTRNRLRRVLDTDSTEGQRPPKYAPYRIESYKENLD